MKSLLFISIQGLEDQGLYRIVGVTSKVNRLLTQGLDKKKIEKLNFDDATEVESKTVRVFSHTHCLRWNSEMFETHLD